MTDKPIAPALSVEDARMELAESWYDGPKGSRAALDAFERAIRAESESALRAATARAERYEKALRAVTVGGIDSRRPLTTDGYENIINGLRYVARAGR